MSPTDFDKRLETDQTLKDSIGGFSSISLYHVRKGWQRWGYSVPIFGSDGESSYCDLDPEIYKEVFNKEPNWDYDMKETMRYNRSSYGEYGAVMDFLLRQPRTPGSKTSFSRSFIRYWGVIDYLSNVAWYTDEKLASWLEDSYDHHKKASEIVSRMFPSYEDLELAISEVRKRQGVQMVYGDKDEFITFLQRNNAKPIDDCSAKFKVRIPSHLVLAVIPLGKYEQHELLGIQSAEAEGSLSPDKDTNS